MIPLISARQEPQLVPASSSLPTASTLWQPPRRRRDLVDADAEAGADGGAGIDACRARAPGDDGEPFWPVGDAGSRAARPPSCARRRPARRARNSAASEPIAVEKGEAPPVAAGRRDSRGVRCAAGNRSVRGTPVQLALGVRKASSSRQPPSLSPAPNSRRRAFRAWRAQHGEAVSFRSRSGRARDGDVLRGRLAGHRIGERRGDQRRPGRVAAN